MKKIKEWLCGDLTAILLVAAFIPVFVLSQANAGVKDMIGTTSIEFLGGEYYRWATCIFFHYDISHIFFNSLALICVGSLVSPFIGKVKTLIIFISGGFLAEIPFSLIVHTGKASYGGGSSGAIYALIAAFLVCWLRFPESFRLKWYRPDLLYVLVFFVLANDNQSSFMTHAFGFIAGTLVTSALVISGVIRKREDAPEAAPAV